MPTIFGDDAGGEGTTVEFGTIEFDQFDGLFENTNDKPSVYISANMVNRYEYDYHRYMAGLTSPNGFQGRTAAIFQLTAPTLLWIADWTIYCQGDLPQCPDPELDDPDWILLDVIPEAPDMLPGADGVSVKYRLSGTYVYAHTNPTTTGSVMGFVVFPRPPYVKTQVDRTFPENKLFQNLINNKGGGYSPQDFPGRANRP